MMGDFNHVTDQHTLDKLIERLKAQPFGEYGYMVQIKTGQRTTKQRNALEVYCRKVAEDLAARGCDMKQVCSLPITPTQVNVKENIWKPIQLAITGKRSTTDLERNEVSDVYMHMSKALAEKFQCVVAFPDRFNR